MASGSFEKRGDMWTVRYRDTLGKQRRTGGFRTKADARQWLDDRMREQRSGVTHDPSLTFARMAEQYLDQHQASDARLEKLGYMVALANQGFGTVPLIDLQPAMIATWAKGLSEGTRHDALAAVKQVLKVAVQWKRLAQSPADPVPNPRPQRREFIPFDDWDEVAELDAAMPEHYRGLVTFVVGTGLRPQEWTKLGWEHIDMEGRAINLPRQIAKDNRSRRIPMRQRAIDAIAHRQQRRGLVFTSPSGSEIDIRNFRKREWAKAFRDARLEPRRPYDMRHTYATWSLRAGASTFIVAKRMGTSIQMIDETYGHFTTDSEAHELFLLDAFDGKLTAGGAGRDLGTAEDPDTHSVPTQPYTLDLHSVATSG